MWLRRRLRHPRELTLRSRRLALVLAGLAIASGLVLALAMSGAIDRVTCPPVRGGTAGMRVQLRDVTITGRFIAFTFGYRAGTGDFAVPAHSVERVGGEVTIWLDGVFTRNPDGSPSYEPAKHVLFNAGRDLRLDDEGNGVVRGTSRGHSTLCPRVLTKVFPISSTFPRGQVFVLFDAGGAITLEPDLAAAEQPVFVSGAGFAPNADVSLVVHGVAVAETRTNERGAFETPFRVPKLPAGTYGVEVRDETGQVAGAVLLVRERP